MSQKLLTLLMKKILASLLIVMSMSLYSASCGFTRPENVQTAVNQAFEENRNADESNWKYNGWEWYVLLAIDEEVLIKHLVSLKKKDVYIIDVGCALGKWGHNIAEILQTKHKDIDTRFHILSVTGGQECQEKELKINDNIILCHLNQFKIENIDEELAQRGFDLENKVDVIVSHWTMRHLVDPFGTLAKMYRLLNPSGGKLFTNGFLFKYEDSKKVEAFPLDHAYILARSNAHALFHYITVGRDVCSLLLERNDDRPLELPLQYTGNIGILPLWRYQCSSNRVTEFRKDKDVTDKLKWKTLKQGLFSVHHYWLEGDERSEKLYASLKEQGLFDLSGTQDPDIVLKDPCRSRL